MTKKHIFFICLIGIVVVLILSGPSLFNYSYNLNNAEADYSLDIQGLAGISAANQTVAVLVPLPLMNGRPAFSNSSFAAELDGWNSSVVQTEYGLMLAFTAASDPLRDIHAFYGVRDVSVDEIPVSGLSGLRFSPETAETKTPYSIHYLPPGPTISVPDVPNPKETLATIDPLPTYDPGTRYEDRNDVSPTLVFIPETLQRTEDDVIISVTYHTNSKYQNVFSSPNEMTGYYTTYILEQIPGNVSGWIPVRPQKFPS